MAPPQGTPGGVKASSAETLIHWRHSLHCIIYSGVNASRSTGGDCVGAAFNDPRTPEKAQRRLSGLKIIKKTLLSNQQYQTFK